MLFSARAALQPCVPCRTLWRDAIFSPGLLLVEEEQAEQGFVCHPSPQTNHLTNQLCSTLTWDVVWSQGLTVLWTGCAASSFLVWVSRKEARGHAEPSAVPLGRRSSSSPPAVGEGSYYAFCLRVLRCCPIFDHSNPGSFSTVPNICSAHHGFLEDRF